MSDESTEADGLSEGLTHALRQRIELDKVAADVVAAVALLFDSLQRGKSYIDRDFGAAASDPPARRFRAFGDLDAIAAFLETIDPELVKRDELLKPIRDVQQALYNLDASGVATALITPPKKLGGGQSRDALDRELEAEVAVCLELLMKAPLEPMPEQQAYQYVSWRLQAEGYAKANIRKVKLCLERARPPKGKYDLSKPWQPDLSSRDPIEVLRFKQCGAAVFAAGLFDLPLAARKNAVDAMIVEVVALLRQQKPLTTL